MTAIAVITVIRLNWVIRTMNVVRIVRVIRAIQVVGIVRVLGPSAKDFIVCPTEASILYVQQKLLYCMSNRSFYIVCPTEASKLYVTTLYDYYDYSRYEGCKDVTTLYDYSRYEGCYEY
jgi:hypothetical protein